MSKVAAFAVPKTSYNILIAHLGAFGSGELKRESNVAVTFVLLV